MAGKVTVGLASDVAKAMHHNASKTAVTDEQGCIEDSKTAEI